MEKLPNSRAEPPLKKKRGGLPNGGKGRPPGFPNKKTRDMREAMAKFVDGNFDKFQKWIERVAKDDPGKASELYLKAVEFNLPKLVRTELRGNGPGATPTKVIVTFVAPGPAGYLNDEAVPPVTTEAPVEDTAQIFAEQRRPIASRLLLANGSNADWMND